MSSSRESLKFSTSDLSDISEDLVAFHLSEDLAFEELLEEKNGVFGLNDTLCRPWISVKIIISNCVVLLHRSKRV